MSALPALPAVPRARRLLRVTVEVAALAAGVALVVNAVVALLRGRPFDFHTFWMAARDVLHGRSPYPPPGLTDASVRTGATYVYPPLVALVCAPFGLLPFAVAAPLFSVLSLAAVAGALGLCGVRDWRVHALALATFPVLQSATLGAVSPLLVLGVAALWRVRHRCTAAAVLVAALVVAKIFLLPLALWFALRRGVRATAMMAAAGLVVLLVPWAIIGFQGLRTYSELTQALALVQASSGFSLVALQVAAGVPLAAAEAAAAAITLGLVVVCCRRGLDERASFGVAVIAGLLFSPVVWLHYLCLLVVPLALAAPRLRLVWLTLLVAWIPGLTAGDVNVGRGAQSMGDERQILLVLGLLGVVLAVSLRAGRAHVDRLTDR